MSHFRMAYIVLLFNSLNDNAMSKKINPKDNQSNQSNPNKGIAGTNKQFDQNQGNRGKQLSDKGGKKK